MAIKHEKVVQAKETRYECEFCHNIYDYESRVIKCEKNHKKEGCKHENSCYSIERIDKYGESCVVVVKICNNCDFKDEAYIEYVEGLAETVYKIVKGESA